MSRIQQDIRRFFGSGSSLALDAEFKPKHDPKNGQFTSGSGSTGGVKPKKGPLGRLKKAQQAERGYSGTLSKTELAAAEKVNKQETAEAEKKAEAKKLKEASKPKKTATPKPEKAPAKKKASSTTSEKAVSSKGKQKTEGQAVSNVQENQRPALESLTKLQKKTFNAPLFIETVMAKAVEQKIITKAIKISSMPKLVEFFKKNASEDQLMSVANDVYEEHSMDHIGPR